MMLADVIVTHAKVLTMDPDRPRAEAVALAGDRILGLGTVAEVDAWRGPCTRVLNLAGATVLPGFVDSHCHLFLGGAEWSDLALAGVTGFDAVSARVRAFSEAHPGPGLIVAQGADYAIFGRAAVRQDLDAILPNRPLALVATDHHTVWANTRALAAAGLLQGAAAPQGGEIVRGPDGLAAGELREPAAFNPVLDLSGKARASLGLSTGGEPDPAPSPQERAMDRDMLARAAAHLAAQGITSAINMDGNLSHSLCWRSFWPSADCPCGFRSLFTSSRRWNWRCWRRQA